MPALVFMALLTVQILFGLNYVISKIVISHFPSLVWASIRIIIASVCMLSVALLRGKPSPRSARDFFIPLIGLALLGTIINQSSFLIGLRYTSSTNSAILNTLIPLFTLLVVTVRGQEPLTTRRLIGFITAFGGVLVLRKIEEFSLSDKTLFGDALTVLNCLSYGLFLSYGKPILEKNDRVWTTTWLFIYGSVGISLISIPDWIGFQVPEMTPTLVWSMIFAVFGGTLATYFLNFWALAFARSTSVAIFIYLQPVVAALLAYFWLGQTITPRTVLSSLIIFAGVMIAILPSRRAPIVAKA